MTVAKNRIVFLLRIFLAVATPLLCRAQDEVFKGIQQRFETFSTSSAQEYPLDRTAGQRGFLYP